MKSLCAYILLPLLMLLALVVWSCGGDERQVVEQLDCAESYLPACPDSAALLLDSLDAAMKGGGWDESSEAFHLYGLLRTMTDALLLRGIHTDSLIRPTYIYYRERMEENDWSASAITTRRYARSAFYLARYESSRDSVSRAEELFQQAAIYSERAEDWRTCYLSYFYQGRSVTASDVVLGCTLLKKSLDLFGRCNDEADNHVYILTELSYNYMILEEYDSAWLYLDEARDIAGDNDITRLKSNIMRQASNIYYQMGNYQEALDYARQYAQQDDDTLAESAKYVLADCFMACDSLDRARSIYQELTTSDDLNIRYIAFRRLASIALLSGQTDLITMLTDSAYSALEEMYYTSMKTKAEYYDLVIEKNTQQYDLQTDIIEKKLQLYILITIMAVVFLVMISFILYKHYETQVERVEKEKEAEISRLKIHEQEVENTNNQNLLYQKNLRIKLMQHLFLEYFEEYKVYIKGETSLQFDTYRWKKIENLLNMMEEDFVSKLRTNFTGFSEEDIQLCMLVKLKFKNSQIADVFNITVEAIKQRKRKLKTKGFAVTDTKITLENILDTM